MRLAIAALSLLLVPALAPWVSAQPVGTADASAAVGHRLGAEAGGLASHAALSGVTLVLLIVACIVPALVMIARARERRSAEE
jgi:hypothetical protein